MREKRIFFQKTRALHLVISDPKGLNRDLVARGDLKRAPSPRGLLLDTSRARGENSDALSALLDAGRDQIAGAFPRCFRISIDEMVPTERQAAPMMGQEPSCFLATKTTGLRNIRSGIST